MDIQFLTWGRAYGFPFTFQWMFRTDTINLIIAVDVTLPYFRPNVPLRAIARRAESTHSA